MSTTKGQTWIEFIVATVIFLFAISFIFITASGNLKSEIQKSQMQDACLKTYELENILQSPGTPANWNSSTGFTVFGLNQNGNKSIIISNTKLLAAKNFTFANVSANSTPIQSWRISYAPLAFGFKVDSSCVIAPNSITFCRVISNILGTYLEITANSTFQNKAKVKLYFPLVAVTAASATNESNDVISTTTSNGTYVTLELNINSTDQDAVIIPVSPATLPKLIFIEQATMENGPLPIILGNNTLLRDSFGASPPPNALVCVTKVNGLLNLTNESVLTSFDLEAW